MNNYNTIHTNFKLNGTNFSTHKELLIFVHKYASSSYSFLLNWFNDSHYIVVNTSGSTGIPKSIELKKEHMINSALATGAHFNLSANTSALLCLSTEFIAGKMMFVRALVLGWHIDIIEPNSDPLNGITKTYDFCAMAPIQLQNSLKKLDLVKKVIVGGAKVPNNLLEKLKGLKTEVFATYGMTETITHIAVKKLNHINQSELDSMSHYELLSNIKIAKDDRGCLVIDAPNISDHQIITNDLVTLISESEFKWLGRYDNIINSGGIKLSPELIEDKLENLLKQRFFVAGVLDVVLGEKLIILIEGKEDSSIYNKLRDSDLLNKFEIPKSIYFLNNFIETSTKKIQRIETLDLIFKN